MSKQSVWNVGWGVIGSAALAALLLNCGGSGGGPASPTPVSSGSSGSASSNTVAINIVTTDGNMSFSPDNVQVASGQQVIWHNADSTTHRIVADAGGVFDTGNLAPGATSTPVTITSTAAIPYHCTIHPSMVGALNGNGAQPAPPCTGVYCG